jgi:outer membrane lipoprotein-sorting protein
MKQALPHLLFFPIISILLLGTTYQSNKAEEFIQRSIHYTISLQDFEARFSYQYLNLSGRQTFSKGFIRFKKNKYILITDDSHIYFNHEDSWVYFPKYNQYMEIEGDIHGNKNVLSHMNSAFSAKATREYKGLENVGKLSCHKISINKIQGDFGYKQAYLWLSPKTLFPVRATFYDTGGGETTYQFSQLRPNVGISDKEFEFQPGRYPGAEKISND